MVSPAKAKIDQPCRSRYRPAPMDEWLGSVRGRESCRIRFVACVARWKETGSHSSGMSLGL